MYSLFPNLRSGLVNAQCEIVSRQSLCIFELLATAKGPVRAKQLQGMLVAVGESWAEGRAGYMAIWNLLRNLQEAGVLSRKGGQGFQLADEQALLDIFTDAIVTTVKGSMPEIGELGELREELLRVVVHHTIRKAAHRPALARHAS